MLQRPERLYRYRSVASEVDLERVREIIVERKLYAAPPVDYNDPFEGRFALVLDAPASLQETRFKQILLDQGVSPAEASAKAQQFAYGPRLPDREMEQLIEPRIVEKVRTETGLVSLTSKNDDVLMWSHYADSHRGICVGFDATLGGSPLSEAMAVRYQEMLPVLDHFKTTDPVQIVYATMLTKHSSWEYEAEWRAISADGARTRLVLPEGSLASVIFGAEIDGHRLEQVREMVLGLNHSVDLIEAIIERDADRIRRVPYRGAS